MNRAQNPKSSEQKNAAGQEEGMSDGEEETEPKPFKREREGFDPFGYQSPKQLADEEGPTNLVL